ncbi:uncharacterized protein LOC100049773 [Xenopus laevis]|uniref:LOC100049773 protein n=1 Tax=Xenopus laevis TaxID=8355 RepID=A5D8Q3_XENLA|nr:uncharacterized protein LOC100049773 [Xenopus laevis]AAI41769.1 LOC100049773 protein [Xenopus laevis]
MQNLKYSQSTGLVNFETFQWIYRIILHATLLVKCCTEAHVTVDPPSNLEIYDPGYLGMLDISWHATEKKGDCTVTYELHYQNGAGNRWKSIRTKHLKHRAAFNLSNEIIVKIRTQLKGPCTNESQIWSDWTEANYSVPLTGTPESKIGHFQCIYYNWEMLKCMWSPGKLDDLNSNYELQYWHKGLRHKMVCDSYLSSHGINNGCVFQSDQLEHYTDFFVLVTGSAGSIPIRPSYFVFQLQDIVKPAAPEELSVFKTELNEMLLEWKLPEGTVPLRCLIFEIQYKEENNIWKTEPEQRETESVIYKSNASNLFCARVRGKVNIFCAADGFWSDWSPEICWKATFAKQGLYIFGGCIAVLTACAIAAALAVRNKRHFSKKLQHKAKEFVLDMDGSTRLN